VAKVVVDPIRVKQILHNYGVSNLTASVRCGRFHLFAAVF
jgi:hypothetical protein